MGYDKEKLRIGYKGRFVVHHHKATSEHWDLRLEFPIESKNKQKTVLRSWAVPKHKLPDEKPVLATETEDHDINYIDFEGTIPEGQYGAGTVKIYDEGDFEIVDLDYDKKYVIKFDGKKIKGYYAIIKTGPKDFLLVKVKDISKYKKSEVDDLVPLRDRRDYGEKKSSIIDYPQDNLCPLIWDNSSPPKIKNNVKSKILSWLYSALSSFKNVNDWLVDISITGSIVTNMYNESTDVDVNVSIDYEKFRHNNKNVSRHIQDNLELRNFLRKYVYMYNGNKLAGDHPIKFFVIGKNKRLESDFIYDIIKDNWIRKPILVEKGFNPDKEFIEAKSHALYLINIIINVLLKAKISITDLLRKDVAGMYTLEERNIVEKDIDEVKELKNLIKNLRQYRFKSDKIVLLGYGFSKNWEFFNIVFKYIEKYGFKDPVKVLNMLLTNEEKKVLETYNLSA